MSNVSLKLLGCVAGLGALAFLPLGAQAHHSFSIYDLDNPIEITGKLTKFQFRNPHVMLEVETEDGETQTVTWAIESMNPGRWDRANVPRDPAVVGDIVTIKGWPGVKGDPIMALSSITTDEKGTTVVRATIRQGQAGSRSGSRGSGMGR